jgi:uncharacterized protein (DUF58 family)
MFAAGLVLMGLAVLTAGWWLLAAGCFLTMVPWAALLALPGGRLELQVEGPTRGRVGATVPMRLTVLSRGRRRLPPGQVSCTRPGFAPVQAVLTALSSGGSTVWELRDEPVARAVVPRATVEVVLVDVFGLCWRRVILIGSTELLIGPRAVAAPPLPDVLGAGDEHELAGLRPWRPGERASAIAWRASARRGMGPGSTLLAREWEPREPQEIRLGLVGGPEPAGERALEVLTAMACAALADGRALTVLLGERAVRVGATEQLLDLFAALPALPDRAPEACDVLVSGGYALAAPATGRTLLVDAEGRVSRR